MNGLAVAILLIASPSPALDSPLGLECLRCSTEGPAELLNLQLGCVAYDAEIASEEGLLGEKQSDVQLVSLEVDVLPAVIRTDPPTADEPGPSQAPRGSSLETPWDEWENRDSLGSEWEDRESPW